MPKKSFERVWFALEMQIQVMLAKVHNGPVETGVFRGYMLKI